MDFFLSVMDFFLCAMVYMVQEFQMLNKLKTYLYNMAFNV